jgi:hypothetical protein
VRRRNCEIVDVDLAALLLTGQLMGCEAADDLTVLQRGEGYEVVAAEQTFEIGRARPGMAIGLRVFERSAKVVNMVSISATSPGARRRTVKEVAVMVVS